MENVYFKEFTYGQKGDYIFWIATAAPLLLWIFLIFKYYFKRDMYKDVHPYTNIFLLLPFVGVFYNIFTSVYNSEAPTMPINWDFCLSTNVPEEEKRKGAVGFYNFTCYNRQSNLAYRYVETYINRMYYINYILLFLVIIIQTNFSDMVSKIKKKTFYPFESALYFRAFGNCWLIMSIICRNAYIYLYCLALLLNNLVDELFHFDHLSYQFI